jgi:hypothetical protein
LPAALRAAFQRHFIASAPSMTASEDPAQAVPGASGSPSPWKRQCIIRTQRFEISAVRGYSAWSM